MAITRRGRRSYFYRSVRSDGRVTSLYLGCGEWAETMARLDSERQRDLAVDRESRRADRERLDAHDRVMGEMFRSVESVAVAVLESHGYARHGRGAWRRRRRPADPAAAGKTAREEVGDLAGGSRAWEGAEESVARVAAGWGDPTGPEATRRELAAVSDALAGPEAPAAVRLLARRAALCWASLGLEERVLADARCGAGPGEQDERLRRVGRRHRQFLRSVTTLALVRRVTAPASPRPRAEAHPLVEAMS